MENGVRKIEELIDAKPLNLIRKQGGKLKDRTSLPSSIEYTEEKLKNVMR